jgi:hypothetical protein
MLGALLFALLQPIPANQAAVMPDTADIQYALASDWIMKSSSGIQFSDYAVRNLVCKPAELAESDKPEDKAPPVFLDPDTPIARASCTFEYAETKMKKRKKREGLYERNVRRFSERELERIPKNNWRKEERFLIRYSKTACMWMGRIPEPGECHYWGFEK